MSTQPNGPQNIKIGVRPETRQKFEVISKARRWSLVTVADELADLFIATERIKVPAKLRAKSKSTSADPAGEPLAAAS